jgi:hypothetical protein
MNRPALLRTLHSVATTQVFLAIAAFVIGTLFWIPAVSFYKRGQIATGTVLSLKEESGAFAPVFLFKDAAGTEHKVESSLYSDPPSFATGQKIQIRYLDDDPKSAKPDTFWDLWMIPILIQGGSLVIFLFAVIGQRALKRFTPVPAPHGAVSR